MILIQQYTKINNSMRISIILVVTHQTNGLIHNEGIDEFDKNLNLRM